MATLVVDHGAIDKLVSHVDLFEEHVRLPAVAALGFIGGASPELSMQVINGGSVSSIHEALKTDKNQSCQVGSICSRHYRNK